MQNTTSALADFEARVTRQIVSFRPNGERFQNTETGRIMAAGVVAFDCGHSYTWNPIGFDDSTVAPRRGVRMYCAKCIQVEMAALKTEASR